MSSLNPRAPSFRIDTSGSSASNAGMDSLSPSPASSKSRGGDAGGGEGGEDEEQHARQGHAHAAVAPSVVASVGAAAGALHPHLHGGQAAHDSSSPSTSSLLTTPPAASSSAQPANPHSDGERDPSLLPLLPTHRRRTTTRSLSPNPSHSSLSSRYSLLPLSTFKRLHLLLFALTFLLLFLLPVVLLVGYRREVQWPPFLLGVASWLAGETLREVIFELFTFEPAGGGVALPLDDGVEGEDDEDLEDRERRRRSRAAASALALPTVIHSIAQEALRLGAVALAVKLLPSTISLSLASSLSSTPGILSPADSVRPHSPHRAPTAPLPPLDPLFFSVLWLALGWAAVEILWGSRRLWKQLELYAEVLGPGFGDAALLAEEEEGVLRGVPRWEEPTRVGGEADGAAFGVQGQENDGVEPGPLRESSLSRRRDYPFRLAGDVLLPLSGPSGNHSPAADAVSASDGDSDAIDEEAFQLRLREMQREELEAQLGVPLYEIPVGVVLVWRVDSILLSLLFTLLLSLPFRLTPPSLFAFPLSPTFTFVALTHALLSLVWVAKVTTWGVPAISYASLVALVMGVFGALAAWGVLE